VHPIDLPCHERFERQRVAGLCGLDVRALHHPPSVHCPMRCRSTASGSLRAPGIGAERRSATVRCMSRPAELADVEERSFWQATMPALPDRRGGDLPDTADVVVIGGGYTGLSAARRAAALGASVVLLEAQTLGWGASTRNGGMCHPGFKWSITSLRKRHGPELGER